LALIRKFALLQALKPDKREFTIMLVPHSGQKVFSLRLPMRFIKAAGLALGVMAAISVGMFINYHYTMSVARSERAELERLRQISSQQYAQIEQLAQTTTNLQNDLERLKQLDTQIRRLINSEELTEPSRSGIVRPNSDSGRGGPMVKPDVKILASNLEEIAASMKEREKSLEQLKQALIERNKRLAATPSIWPTYGEVTSRFGYRNSPEGRGSYWHEGIDIANNYGTPVMATADGVVKYSGWYGGYGKLIEIDHGYGIVTRYGHMSSIIVSNGQRVKKGEVIGYMGNTGISTGPHLHYEVRVNGTAVNPAKFL